VFLEKLEIQGFKSFAEKNVLAFPGIIQGAKQGLTGIVGPNGSGKSNISDAVRWALGEQSLKSLRGKKAEDVIFSGTEKRGKLGMAEVSLYLNNSEDKTGVRKRAPIDYTELVITRRIYRDGNSEYLINNNKVRLIDVQMLLAKANVGQKTYSVIGQGTVDNFLNSSLAERKEFFDEATGVKQYQIKRDTSLNKLRTSYENLVQAQMLLTEIEPRLASLTRQVNKLRKRGDLETELKEKQLIYYSNIWHENNNKFAEYNYQFLDLEKEKMDKDRKLEGLNKDLGKYEVKQTGESEYELLQKEFNKELSIKEGLERKLAKADAQLEMKLESAGKFDLSFLLNKRESLDKEIKNIEEELVSLENNISHDRGMGDELRVEADSLEKKIQEKNNKIKELNQKRNDIDLNRANEKFDALLFKLNKINNLSDLDEIKRVIAEIYTELEEIFNNSEDYFSFIKNDGHDMQNEWQETHEDIQKLIKEKEILVTRINENNLRISARSERVKLLNDSVKNISNELITVEAKLKQNSEDFDFEEINREQVLLKKEIEIADEKILAIKNKIGKINREEEEKRSKLLKLQREIQMLQGEINDNNYKLNEIKVQATRFETKLEDLEVEIREELGSLSEVKSGNHLNDVINVIELKGKIISIKKQLEHIGGIDPQTEQEYNETKERYDYLSGQADDLNKAIDSLEEVIRELDKTIKEKFDREFNLIAKKFEEYFRILFSGGTAKIEKVIEDPEEIKSEVVSSENKTVNEDGVENEIHEEGEKKKKKEEPVIPEGFADIKKIKFLQKHNATGLAGVEISACPPGKKIASVSMLSGGEKALTAIALICAIISNNPSPFVFLDEVDAALDEANSERLAKILDDLSHKTQFIVVTHNRASMKRASVLYGVTMGDDGVSKLVSVKIDDAVEKARY